MSSRRRINPPAMSKPVPKSNMLPGSGVIDTVSLPEIGPSVTRNCIGWRVEESIPVKTTLVSAMGREVMSEDMLNPVNVVETKSLLAIKKFGVKVTPVQVNVTSAGGIEEALVVSVNETELVGVKVPAPLVQDGAGVARVSKGATRAAGISNRSLLSMDLIFIVFVFLTCFFDL
jgi:hypothetical protein